MSTIKKDPFISATVLVTGILLFMLSFAFGLIEGTRLKKEEAIRFGVAEWVGDRDGKPQFKWKETQK